MVTAQHISHVNPIIKPQSSPEMMTTDLTEEEYEVLQKKAERYYEEKEVELLESRREVEPLYELTQDDLDYLSGQEYAYFQRIVRQEILEKRRKASIALRSEYFRRIEAVETINNFSASQYMEMALMRLNQKFAPKAYKLTEETRWMLEMLCCYFAKDEDFYWYAQQTDSQGKRRLVVDGECSLEKGLALFGPTGVGKSSSLEVFGINPRLSYVTTRAKYFAEAFQVEGYAGITKYYSWQAGSTQKYFGQSQIGLMVDDVGNEILGKHFGNEVETVEAVLYERWDRLPGEATHFTTNLKRSGKDLTTLESRYGTRFVSRMMGKMNLLRFPKETPDFRLL